MVGTSVVCRVIVMALFALLGLHQSGLVGAARLFESSAISVEPVQFQSGDVTLDGAVLTPIGAGQRPALVMVHGAGLGRRDDLRPEAEAFARAGIVTLIYDKRTAGYSASGVGGRSFDLLADDALAAVRALQMRPDVAPTNVGLWGLSEGAWVASIAAARSERVAFLVLVGASGVSPASQVSWNLESRFQHNGVSGSLSDAVARTGVRFLADLDLLAEAHHDPAPVLARAPQPVLALWGALDRVAAPADSSRIIQQALAQGGNQRSTIRHFPGADHDLRISPDGYAARTSRDPLAEGYIDAVTDWIERVVAGESPGPVADAPPPQAIPVRPLTQPAWHESGAAQAIMTASLVAAFGMYPASALARRLASRSTPSTVRVAPAAWLATTGLASIFGCFAFVSYAVLTQAAAITPAIAGRPWAAIVLHGLAWSTVVLALWTGAEWWASRRADATRERMRLGILLAGGLAFIPWAASWGLLVP